jgi:hypothetical protein
VFARPSFFLFGVSKAVSAVNTDRGGNTTFEQFTGEPEKSVIVSMKRPGVQEDGIARFSRVVAKEHRGQSEKIKSVCSGFCVHSIPFVLTLFVLKF